MHGPSTCIFFLDTSCNIQKTKRQLTNIPPKKAQPFFFPKGSVCTKPRGILQLLQAPVRLVFFLRLCHVQSLNNNIQECVRQLTHSAAWRTSKVPFPQLPPGETLGVIRWLDCLDPVVRIDSSHHHSVSFFVGEVMSHVCTQNHCVTWSRCTLSSVAF